MSSNGSRPFRAFCFDPYSAPFDGSGLSSIASIANCTVLNVLIPIAVRLKVGASVEQPYLRRIVSKDSLF